MVSIFTRSDLEREQAKDDDLSKCQDAINCKIDTLVRPISDFHKSIHFLEGLIDIKYMMICNIQELMRHLNITTSKDGSSSLPPRPELKWIWTPTVFDDVSVKSGEPILTSKRIRLTPIQSNSIDNLFPGLLSEIAIYLSPIDAINLGQCSRRCSQIGRTEWLKYSYLRCIRILIDVRNLLNMIGTVDGEMWDIVLVQDLVFCPDAFDLLLSEDDYEFGQIIRNQLDRLGIDNSELPIINSVQFVRDHVVHGYSPNPTNRFMLFDYQQRFGDTSLIGLEWMKLLPPSVRKHLFENKPGSPNPIAEDVLSPYMEISRGGPTVDTLVDILKITYSEEEYLGILENLLISVAMHGTLENVIVILNEFTPDKQIELAWPCQPELGVSLFLNDYPLLLHALSNDDDEWNTNMSIEWVQFFFSKKLFPANQPRSIIIHKWEHAIDTMDTECALEDVRILVREKMVHFSS